ncbi:MAG: FAD:protein FMN transferase [Gammaproteobacteria bacterium]|nr:MAG: FAD:protein FMN transferase [Gammaproteobacteria bacterium]
MTSITIPATDNPAHHPDPTLQGSGRQWQGRFEAMASPCEILLENVNEAEAKEALQFAARETWRMEHKFSRYVAGNPVDRINQSHGTPIHVDNEMALMLDYAAQCFELSDGRFDITSGVLRRAWKFDGGDHLPDRSETDALLRLVGWNRVQWEKPSLTLPDGMEIDFGGIGKEYAVDRILLDLNRILPDQASVLVNFGGDLACNGPRANGNAWVVGVEDHKKLSDSTETLSLRGGALATSGDSRRYLINNGVRYGHILDPRTGWPIPDAPHSVTVAAPTCTLAGMLATFAMLQGGEAEAFLQEQQVPFWVQRS